MLKQFFISLIFLGTYTACTAQLTDPSEMSVYTYASYDLFLQSASEKGVGAPDSSAKASHIKKIAGYTISKGRKKKNFQQEYDREGYLTRYLQDWFTEKNFYGFTPDSSIVTYTRIGDRILILEYPIVRSKITDVSNYEYKLIADSSESNTYFLTHKGIYRQNKDCSFEIGTYIDGVKKDSASNVYFPYGFYCTQSGFKQIQSVPDTSYSGDTLILAYKNTYGETSPIDSSYFIKGTTHPFKIKRASYQQDLAQYRQYRITDVYEYEYDKTGRWICYSDWNVDANALMDIRRVIYNDSTGELMIHSWDLTNGEQYSYFDKKGLLQYALSYTIGYNMGQQLPKRVKHEDTYTYNDKGLVILKNSVNFIADDIYRYQFVTEYEYW